MVAATSCCQTTDLIRIFSAQLQHHLLRIVIYTLGQTELNVLSKSMVQAPKIELTTMLLAGNIIDVSANWPWKCPRGLELIPDSHD